ncbi:MAG: hypothetical protein KDD50_01010 [Bdellovibrionales bacterium]|nr:hypothetical protein [Bdellovibrionales bacterium]
MNVLFRDNLKSKSKSNKTRDLKSISSTLLIMAFFLTHCTKEGSNTFQMSLVEGGNNQSGYAGKLKPGDYYARKEGSRCTPVNSSKNTDIVGILEITHEGVKNYYSGCDKANANLLLNDQIKYSESNLNVLSVPNLQLNFEYSVGLPEDSDPKVYGLCLFFPKERVNGFDELLDLQVLFYRTSASTFQANVSFSEILNGQFNAGSLGQFTTNEDSTTYPGYEVYNNLAKEFVLKVSVPTISKPDRIGELTYKSGSEEIHLFADLCLFN